MVNYIGNVTEMNCCIILGLFSQYLCAHPGFLSSATCSSFVPKVIIKDFIFIMTSQDLIGTSLDSPDKLIQPHLSYKPWQSWRRDTSCFFVA